MKKKDARLISRGMDGDLSPAERTRLEELLSRHAEAADFARVWQGIGDQLRIDAAQAPVPDALLDWQEIRRKIRTGGSPARAGDAPDPAFGLRLQWLSGVASVLLIGLITWSIFVFYLRPRPDAFSPASVADRVEWVVAGVPGATTMIYTDTETDMTVIWMDLAQPVDPRDS